MICIYENCNSNKIRARGLCSTHWNLEQYGLCSNKCSMPAANSSGICSNCINRGGLPPKRRNYGSKINSETKRLCSMCKEIFDIEEFYKSHHKNRCIKCQERMKKHSMLMSKYNISIMEWEKILLSQNNVCKICKEPGKMCVDHDHSCCANNKTCGSCIRGIICDRCNRAIGLIKDNSNYAYNMYLYLNEYYNKKRIK